MKKKDVLKWVESQHTYWWEYLFVNVFTPPEFDIIVPDVKFTYRISRVAGRANSTWCQYNIPYALQEGENYDETICHEVCHVFAKRLCKNWNEKHGSLWYYLYQVVCGFDRGAKHTYRRPNPNNPLLKKLQEKERILKQLAKLSE